MKNTKIFSPKWLRYCFVMGVIAISAFLTQCTEEAPPPPVQESKPSLVDQYKNTSKESAANPGVAGSPGQMKEEEKKEGQ
jgi:hypothetical protein